MTWITYTRKFEITMSHFNDQYSYNLYYQWMDGEGLSTEQWTHLLSQIHGHDLGVRMAIQGNVPTPEGKQSIVHDQDLESIVKQWYNVNLSVHPDFAYQKIRATTENMARILADKIIKFDNVESVDVEISEGKNVRAATTLYR